MSIFPLCKMAGEPEDLYSKAPQGGIDHLLFMARVGDSLGQVSGPANPPITVGALIAMYGWGET